MVHRFRTFWGVVLTGVLWGGSARADVLHLKTGGRLEGILVGEGPATLTIDMGSGKLSLPRSSVVRIERKESALAEYRARLASVSRGDVSAYAELARYATEHGLRSEARIMWARVVSLDPRNVEGHLALGHVLVDGRYVDEDSARQASGMVRFEGSWMTPSEQDSILRGREQRRDDDRRVEDARRATRDAEERALRAEREADRARAAAADAMSPWGYGSNVTVGSPYWGGYGGTVSHTRPRPRPVPAPTPIPQAPPVRPSSIR